MRKPKACNVPPLAGNWRDSWKPGWVVHEGKVYSMAEWTEATGITAQLIGFRLHKLGWSEHDAMTKSPHTPYRPTFGADKQV